VINPRPSGHYVEVGGTERAPGRFRESALFHIDLFGLFTFRNLDKAAQDARPS
jgi:hypothetical protein